MCLTEPGAGSNLGALETTACPEGDHFRIKGSKIFISWGQHDLTENIIHLVLARIKGAPSGTGGISLFVVPKIRVNDEGTLTVPNDVVCTGIEHKCGLHAAPTAALAFGSRDDCIGYLCGEKNKGLAHMFQMMNGARINSAVSAMTMAGSAYRNALAYVQDRVQGRDIAGRVEGDVTIINHPDVRRMLLWMKAAVDGMRSMVYTTAFWEDLAKGLPLAVGTPVTQRPPHSPGRAVFPHPVLRLYSLSRKASALGKHPMSFGRYWQLWLRYTESLNSFEENLPRKAFPFPPSSVQPLERTPDRPLVKPQ
jgi:hypothetical protein